MIQAGDTKRYGVAAAPAELFSTQIVSADSSLSQPKEFSRQAKCVGGIDLGGTYTKVRIQDSEGRVGEAILPTYQHGDEPIAERTKGLVASTVAAVQKACEKGGIDLSKVDGIGFGAPGSKDPATGMIKMPNAIGKDGSGQMVWVPFEQELSKALKAAGLRDDAVVVGDNDCSVAAAAEKLGDTMSVFGPKDDGWKTLAPNETSLYLLIGTGVGGGWATGAGIIPGATGATEVGHIEVPNKHPAIEGLSCGCGKPHTEFVCMEAISSVTGQTNVFRNMLKLDVKTNDIQQKGVELFFETREANKNELTTSQSLSENRRIELEKSIAAVDKIIPNTVIDISAVPDVKSIKLSPTDYLKLLDDVQFDAAIIDKYANAPEPFSVASDSMQLCGKYFGVALRNLLQTSNPKRVIIGGGGAKTFKRGDAETNAFWRGMKGELGPEYDMWESLRKTYFVAAVGDENLGIQGSIRHATDTYERKAT